MKWERVLQSRERKRDLAAGQVGRRASGEGTLSLTGAFGEQQDLVCGEMLVLAIVWKTDNIGRQE